MEDQMLTLLEKRLEDSGVNFQEQRKDLRLMTFCKVYKDDQILGFVIDLSKGGLKLWLNKDIDLAINDSFTIEIQPPADIQSDIVPIKLEVVWKNPDRTSLLSEVGCEFRNLNGKQEDHIDFLLSCFA